MEPSTPGEPVPRDAARVVVLAPGERVLLHRLDGPDGRSWWICPGGGLAEGETHEAAARRELWEETGHAIGPAPLPWVWHRDHVFDWQGARLRQRERFFLLRVADAYEPAPRVGESEICSEQLTNLRWWSVADMARAEGVTFAPGRMAGLLADLLRDGPPALPIDAGV